MMQQQRKTIFALLIFIIVFVMSFSIFSNQTSIQQFHQHHHSSFHQTAALPHYSTLHNQFPGPPLNKSTPCTSTVEYSGRRPFFPSVARRTDSAVLFPGCDLFSGRWVFDNTSYPLYKESDCPYMSDQLACQRHGRPDSYYYYWRWQPHNCDLKRWNVTEMWEKLRGKRLMFVGDSLNRGQWISMLCLLHSAVPANKQSITPQAQLTIFRAEEYNSTIEFMWLPLLVESNSDDPVDHRLPERILSPDSVYNRHASQWKNADILVFNSYLWWKQSPVKLFKGEWEAGSKGGNCYSEKYPINPTDDNATVDDGSGLMKNMVDEVLRRLSSKVIVINITRLSMYRKDGHPSIYRKFWETSTAHKMSDPETYSDCIHWCLPGVPDVWNQLLFHFL